MRRGAITDTNFQYEFPNQLFATQTKCVVGSFQAACKISCHASVPPMLGWYEFRPGQLARPDGSPVLGRKQHYLPVMKATNSDSKRCQVSVDVSFQPPSCFQRKKAHTLSSQPHRLLLGGVQSKQPSLWRQRFDVCSKFPTLNCDRR